MKKTGMIITLLCALLLSACGEKKADVTATPTVANVTPAQKSGHADANAGSGSADTDRNTDTNRKPKGGRKHGSNIIVSGTRKLKNHDG